MAIDAGTILAAMDLDTSKFVNALHSARDQLAGFSGNGIEGALTSIGSAAVTTGRMLTMGVTTPLTGAASVAIKWAGDVEESANKVATIADTSVVSMDKLQAGVTRLSNDTGIAATDINEALYQTISATGDTANAIAYTGIAAQAAKGGFTDTSTAIDGLTGVMNAYGLKGEAAMRAVSDQMLMAQNYGKTTFGEIAGSIGNVIPLAAKLGVSTDELFASVATLTKQSIETSEATTGLKAAFSNIIKPSAEAAKEAKKLGLDFSVTALQSKGLAGFLQDIMDKTGGNTETLARLFGSVEAVNNIVALTSETGAKDFVGAMDAMKNSAGATQAAYNQMQEGFNAGLTKLLNSGKNLAISFGNILLPVATDAIGLLSRGVSAITGLDDGVKRLIVKAGALAAAAGPVLLVGGKLLSTFSGLVAPLGLVAAGFAAAYNIFPEFASVVDNGIGAVKDFGKSLLDGQSVTEAFAGAIERSFGRDALNAIISFGTSAKRRIGDAVNTIKTGAVNMGNALRTEAAAIKTDWSEGGALGALSGFAERIHERIEEALPKIGEAALGIRDKIGEGISAGVEWFAPKARTMLGNLGAALGNAKDYAVAHLPAVREAIADGLQVAKTKLGAVSQTALGNLSTAYRDAKAYALEHLPAVRDTIADGLQVAKTKLSTMAQTALGNLSTAYRDAKAYALEHLPAVRTAIANGLQVAKTTLITKAQNAMTWLGEAYRSDEVQGLLGDLSGVATTIAGKISVTKAMLTTKAGELLQRLGEALGTDEAKAKITEITGIASAIAGKISSGAADFKIAAGKLIGDLVTQLTDNGFLTTLIGDDKNGLGGIVTAIAGGIGAAAGNIASAASDIGSELIGALTKDDGKLIGDLLTNASVIVGAIGGKIVDAAGDIAASATSLATNLLSGLNDIDWATLGSQAGISLGNIAGNLLDAIVTNAPKVVGNARPLVEAIGGGIVNAGEALGSASGQLIGSLITWMLSAENWERLLKLGASLVMGIGEGMTHIGDYLLESAASGIESFVRELKTSLTGEAPSAYDQFLADTYQMTGEWGREMEVTGNWIAASLHPGHIFVEGTDSLKNAISAYAIAAGQGFQDEFANVSYLANDAVVGLLLIVTNSMESETDRAKAAAALMMAGYTDAVAQSLGAAKGGVQIGIAAHEMMDSANAEVMAASAELGTLIPGALSNGYESGIPILQRAAQRLGNIASGAWEKDTTLKDAEDVAKGVTDSTAKKLDDGKQDVTTSADGITTAVEGSLEPLPGRMEALSQNGVLGMSTAIDDNKSAVTTSMDTLADETVQTALRTMSRAQGHEIGAAFAQAISTGLLSQASALTTSSGNTARYGVQAAGNAMTYFDGYGIGASMVDGIIGGVASRAGALASRMRDLARSAVSAAKRALDINSPSGVMEREVGAWLPGGIGVGVARNMQDALGPLEEVRRSMVNVFDNTLGGVRLGTPDVPWAPAGGYGGSTPVVHIEITGDWQVRSDDDRDDIIDALYERISEQLRRR